MAESRHSLTVNMHAYARYANDCLWPKADVRTESESPLANVCFGEKSGHSGDSIRLLIRVFSTVGVCSDLADKAKPAQGRGRKATGPRFLRDALRRHEGPQDGRAADWIPCNGLLPAYSGGFRISEDKNGVAQQGNQP